MVTPHNSTLANAVPTVDEAAASTVQAARPMTVYYLAWRWRRSHPWQSEEHSNRFDAHSRYLRLLERGLEVYLETRHRAE